MWWEHSSEQCRLEEIEELKQCNNIKNGVIRTKPLPAAMAQVPNEDGWPAIPGTFLKLGLVYATLPDLSFFFFPAPLTQGVSKRVANVDLCLVPKRLEYQVAGFGASSGALLQEGKEVNKERIGSLLNRLKKENEFAIFRCTGKTFPPHFPKGSELLLTHTRFSLATGKSWRGIALPPFKGSVRLVPFCQVPPNSQRSLEWKWKVHLIKWV